MTKRQAEILRQMAERQDDDEGEIAYEKGIAYLGNTRIAARTVFALLRMMAISMSQFSTVGTFERYQINETGRKLREAQK
jgi:hypothetical protein